MLLEYLNEGEQNTLGWRVTEGGAVEELAEGGSWHEAFQLDDGGLADLRAAIGETLAKLDRDHYEPVGSVSHPRRLTWHLGDREIVVDGFPIMKVAPLDELLQTLLRLRFRGEGAVSTVWTWGDQRREFDGEPADVPKLGALLDLVLPAGDAGGGSPAPAAGSPLVAVQWLVGGEPGDSVEVFPDGRRVVHEDGKAREAAALGPDQVTELRERLSQLA